MQIIEAMLNVSFLMKVISYGFLLVILINHKRVNVELNKSFFLIGLFFWIASLVRVIAITSISGYGSLDDQIEIIKITSSFFILGRNFLVFGLIVTFSNPDTNNYSQNIFRLLFFSIITFGLYGIYWIYRKQVLVNGKPNLLISSLLLILWTLHFSALDFGNVIFDYDRLIFGTCYSVVFLTAAFQLKSSLLQKKVFKYYSDLNNFYIFFFAIFYLQVKLNQIKGPANSNNE